MSTSRSVAAAQRRRAGPPEPQQIRGPNTSINSSQVFSGQQQQQQQQLRPGTTGRLAGQQAALQQQQFQQQQQQQSNLKQDNNQQGSKMTLPQAITLITLRLGRLETQVTQLDSNTSLVNENGEVVDSQLIDSILERLDFLEQEKQNNVNSNNQDIKQQLETLKLNINAIRNSCAVNNKEIKLLKNEIDNINIDLTNTKLIVDEWQLSTTIQENIENELIIENPSSEGLNLLVESEIEIQLEPVLETENQIDILSQSQNVNIEIDSNQNLNFEKEPEPFTNSNDNISLKEIIQQELKESGISINNNNQVSNKKSTKFQKSAK